MRPDFQVHAFICMQKKAEPGQTRRRREQIIAFDEPQDLQIRIHLLANFERNTFCQESELQALSLKNWDAQAWDKFKIKLTFLPCVLYSYRQFKTEIRGVFWVFYDLTAKV